MIFNISTLKTQSCVLYIKGITNCVRDHQMQHHLKSSAYSMWYVLSFTTAASCFLSSWHAEWTTCQRGEHGCCSAVQHKKLLSISRRRQANWRSAGGKTKASVTSLWGNGGLHGGCLPQPFNRCICPPFVHPFHLFTANKSSPNTMCKWHQRHWTRLWLQLWQRELLFLS